MKVEANQEGMELDGTEQLLVYSDVNLWRENVEKDISFISQY
jgi:hypothetical protein